MPTIAQLAQQLRETKHIAEVMGDATARRLDTQTRQQLRVHPSTAQCREQTDQLDQAHRPRR